MELRRIEDRSLDLQNPTSLLARYALDQGTSTITLSNINHEPGLIVNSIRYLSNFAMLDIDPNNSTEPWFPTRYGLTSVNCNVTLPSIRTSDFVYDTSVPTNTLFNIGVNNARDNGTGQIILPPIDTSMELGGLLGNYLTNLTETNNALSRCGSDQNCRNRVTLRLRLDAQNRFDDYIIQAANNEGVPALVLKLFLMQESQMVPALTANASQAVGIAQFVPIAAQDLVNNGRAPIGIVTGTQYIPFLDGIATNCVVQGVSASPTSETSCVDFQEVQRAISDAAFFIDLNHSQYLPNTIGVRWTAFSEGDRWLLAVASYNAGASAVANAVAQTSANNIDAVCPFLSLESRQYVRNVRLGIPGAGSNGTCG